MPGRDLDLDLDFEEPSEGRRIEIPNKLIFFRGFVMSFVGCFGVGTGIEDEGFFLALGVLGVTVELVVEDSGREGIL